MSGLRAAVVARAGQAVAIGVTLWLLGDSPTQGGVTAGLFFAFTLASDAADLIVGDGARHVVFGAPVLAGAGWLLVRGDVGPVAIGGVVVGGWLVVDGVQHLRYGVGSTMSFTRPRPTDSRVRVLVWAVGRRLLRPFRLPLE
jgi:hypothetical protein